MNVTDIAGLIFVTGFILFLNVIALGEYSDKIIRIIKEIKRKY